MYAKIVEVTTTSGVKTYVDVSDPQEDTSAITTDLTNKTAVYCLNYLKRRGYRLISEHVMVFSEVTDGRIIYLLEKVTAPPALPVVPATLPSLI